MTTFTSDDRIAAEKELKDKQEQQEPIPFYGWANPTESEENHNVLEQK